MQGLDLNALKIVQMDRGFRMDKHQPKTKLRELRKALRECVEFLDEYEPVHICNSGHLDDDDDHCPACEMVKAGKKALRG